jgi:hypothetical protein
MWKVMFTYIRNKAFQATSTILDSELSSVLLVGIGLAGVITTVKEASNGVAVSGGNPKVGRASIEDNGESLRRCANINFTVVLFRQAAVSEIAVVVCDCYHSSYLGVHVVGERNTMFNSAISVRGRDLVLLGLVALSTKVLLGQVLAGMSVALSSISRGLRDFLDRNSIMIEITREVRIWNVHRMPSLRLLGIPNRACAASLFLLNNIYLARASAETAKRAATRVVIAATFIF